MYKHLPTFQKLVRQLQKVPYLASKNVYKVALYFLQSNKQAIEHLFKTITQARSILSFCKACYNLAEDSPLCMICNDKQRDSATLCIVESWHDLIAIENLGEYNGLYHILGGALCPLEGIGPENLTINILLNRLEKKTFKELIFATSSTPEGEATASYIFSKIPKNSLLKTTKLACGIPTGSTLAYMDRITIAKSLLDRKPF
jgi:recombination protein RecR